MWNVQIGLFSLAFPGTFRVRLWTINYVCPGKLNVSSAVLWQWGQQGRINSVHTNKISHCPELSGCMRSASWDWFPACENFQRILGSVCKTESQPRSLPQKVKLLQTNNLKDQFPESGNALGQLKPLRRAECRLKSGAFYLKSERWGIWENSGI